MLACAGIRPKRVSYSSWKSNLHKRQNDGIQASHAMGLVRDRLHLLFRPATENATCGKKRISSIYQEDVDRSSSFSGVPAFHTTLTGRLKADECFLMKVDERL